MTSGRRAFLLGPTGLPPRDLTVTVQALDGQRVLASTRVEHVFGLPAAAAKVAPPQRIDGRWQQRVARLPARTGVTSAAWLRDLGSGQHRCLQRRARTSRRPARSSSRSCSACSRARAPTRCARHPGRSSSRSCSTPPTARPTTLLPRAGGAARSTSSRGLGATGTFTCCGYLLEAGERASSRRERRGRCRPRRSSTSPRSRAASTRPRTTSARCSSRSRWPPPGTARRCGRASRRARRASRCGCSCTRPIPGSCARPSPSRSRTRPAGCPTSSTTPRSCSRRAARSSPCS